MVGLTTALGEKSLSTSSAAQGNQIAIVIPTLKKSVGVDTGQQALIAAGCSVPVRVIVSVDKKREGFTRTVNAGIVRADESADICILNDDVTNFQFGWLEQLRRGLYSNSIYGLSGPSGKSAAAPMNSGLPGMMGLQVVEQISFWCVLLKREMLSKLGLLDEAFIHYCSDNWYCHVMNKKGWRCVWVKSVYLEHEHRGSGMQSKWRKHDRTLYFKRLRQ